MQKRPGNCRKNPISAWIDRHRSPFVRMEPPSPVPSRLGAGFFKQLVAISASLLLHACGDNGTRPTTRSSPQVNAKAPVTRAMAPASRPPAIAAEETSLGVPSTLHMGEVMSVEPGQAIAGQSEVKVTYTRGCQQTFQRLIHEKLTPLSASHPTVAVGIMMDTQPIDCHGPDVREAKTFSVPAVSGQYTFRKIMPWRTGFTRHQEIGLARIKAIKQVSPLSHRVDVKVTYVRACHERFKGVTRALVAPLNVDHPHFALGVLVASDPASCATQDVEETVTFRMPAIRGSYRFLPIAQD